MEDVLRKVTEFGDVSHGSQMRKYTPERYMVHPVRVMETCRTVTNDLAILSAALLHDVLEDTAVTKGEMLDFLSGIMPVADAERTVRLVVELSDVYVKKDYPQLNRRTRKSKELERLSNTSADSQTIKYADILDNTLEIVDQDPAFAKVFLNEVQQILRKLDKGHPQLRNDAQAAVAAGLNKLRSRH